MGFFGVDKDKPVKKEKVVEEDSFLCAECDTEYDTKEECDKCECPTKCKACGEVYDTKDEAVECCRTYTCEKCEAEYDTNDEAVECCIPKFCVTLTLEDEEEDREITGLTDEERIEYENQFINNTKIFKIKSKSGMRYIRIENIKEFAWYKEE